MGTKKSSDGFTIVELLIVIVVIGILAAITIVGYGGIQQRTLNTARVQSAKEYYKTILQYQIINSSVIATASYCLGDGHADSDADATPDCYANNTKYNENVTVNNRIKQITSKLPAFPSIEVSTNTTGGISNGIAYNSSSTRVVNGTVQPYLLIYVLEGNAQDCGIQGVVRAISSNVYDTGNYPYMSTNSLSTTCFITLPGPENL